MYLDLRVFQKKAYFSLFLHVTSSPWSFFSFQFCIEISEGSIIFYWFDTMAPPSVTVIHNLKICGLQDATLYSFKVK